MNTKNIEGLVVLSDAAKEYEYLKDDDMYIVGCIFEVVNVRVIVSMPSGRETFYYDLKTINSIYGEELITNVEEKDFIPLEKFLLVPQKVFYIDKEEANSLYVGLYFLKYDKNRKRLLLKECKNEFAIVWNKVGAQLQMFNDTWQCFDEFKEFFSLLSELSLDEYGEDVEMQKVMRELYELNYLYITE